MQIHVSGRIALCECRFSRAGVPVLQLELQDGSGQVVCITHSYPDASNASGYAARALASSLRGQHVELDVVEPRFRKGRLDAVAPVIHPPTTTLTRKDIE